MLVTTGIPPHFFALLIPERPSQRPPVESGRGRSPQVTLTRLGRRFYSPTLASPLKRRPAEVAARGGGAMNGRESIQTMGNTGMKRSTTSVAQRRFPPLSGRKRLSRLPVRRCTSATVALVGLALCVFASGCRSGVTSLSAPKWWSFGDAKSANAKNFSSAPAFGGSVATASADSTIKKPSEVATAYPTTSTPNGYAMAGSAPAASAAAAAVIPAATAEPSAVTYGVTPPARSQSMPAVTSQVASTTIDPSVPQMGRYESMPAPPAPAPAAPPPPAASGFAAGYPAPAAPLAPPPADPAATATAGMAPAPSAFPATAGYEPVRERLAENRSIDGLGPAAAVAAANPGLTPVEQPPLAEPAASSGYRNISGSRFAGGTPALPAVAAAAPFVPPPAPVTPAAATPPAATPPAVWTPPGAASGGPAATPAVAPPRRPDPVYRPAGTSSYKPSEQILVDDPPASPSAVRTAGYEMPFPTAPRDPQPIDQ